MAEKASAGSPEQGMKSLNRAIDLVRLVAADEPDGVRFSDIVSGSDLPKATVHRILATLRQQSWIDLEPASGRYQLGSEFLALSNAVAERQGIVDQARLALPRLSAELGETIYLSARSGYDRVCIDRHESSRPIRTVTMDVGTRQPLGVGAGSLALIANLPDTEIEAILDHNDGRFGEFPKVTRAECRRIVAAARQRGYASHTGIMVENLSGIAVPLFDRRGSTIASISVALLTKHLDGARERQVVAAFRREADRLESEIRPAADDDFGGRRRVARRAGAVGLTETA